LSQLSGPLLLGLVGSKEDYGFWIGVALLTLAPLLLLGRDGAPVTEAYRVTFKNLLTFCRGLPAIAWGVALFAAFEAMVLTLLPVYSLRQGFSAEIALAMVSTVVVGDALLQLPIGALADRLSRRALFTGCAVLLMLSSLAVPLLLHTLLIWPLWVIFGASAGGLFTLSLILIGERFRDDALVRANAHVAQLWGIGCLIGPLAAGAGSQWISGHALPLFMAAGAFGLVILVLRRVRLEPTVRAAVAGPGGIERRLWLLDRRGSADTGAPAIAGSRWRPGHRGVPRDLQEFTDVLSGLACHCVGRCAVCRL